MDRYKVDAPAVRSMTKRAASVDPAAGSLMLGAPVLTTEMLGADNTHAP